MAATIRDIGGVPPIQEICDEAHRVARERSAILPIDGAQPKLWPKKDRLPQVDLAWSQARMLVETRAEELAADRGTARHEVAVRVVRALAYQFGFGRFLPGLVEKKGRTWSADEVRDRCAQVLARPGIDKLADALLRRPDGNGVKAPPRRRPSAKVTLETAVDDL
ncbi:hypothetical protein ACTIVE_1817 [Actinomadura verrucosospora]|uniref:Uncharacterized protein n=1 Tax=Actinomadura verrucosospora TaxID=46165 RepID=A0A7D3VQ70_ACTVE|nr:hypothetical protein ACTIVE_1817 [Actinomadura verrucosospora]